MKLSQLKANRIRTKIPCFYQEDLIGEIEVYNPTIEEVNLIKQGIESQAIDDKLRESLLRTLTNIDVDCEIDEDFVKYYSDVFVSVMLEIDAIILEVSTNYAKEVYNVEKLPEDKKALIIEATTQANEIISGLDKRDEERNKQRKIMELDAEIQLKNEELEYLRGDSK